VVKRETLVLGAGVTGLGVGWASQALVVEANEEPGGICASYYLQPDGVAGAGGRGYRFERGGGHWIFGGDRVVLDFLQRLSPCKRYVRNAAVYLPELDLFVPYPLQNHLAALPATIASRALEEVVLPRAQHTPPRTMEEWLLLQFGPTLCELFFFPFHELYTAGLFRRIAPQDPYKSPASLRATIRGALGFGESAGYNTTFLYPEAGLDHLVGQLAAPCRLRPGCPAVGIAARERELHLADGTVLPYAFLVSTLPLSETLRLAGLSPVSPQDPATGVVVVNVGGRKGANLPPYHWVYFPKSTAGFHRVGVYSNVEPGFLPASRKQEGVAFYVEHAFLAGETPSPGRVQEMVQATLAELSAMGWLGEAEVVDATVIPVAYTWSWPGSRWREEAQELLRQHGILPAGRFGRWHFQGIAESLAEGLLLGATLSGEGTHRGRSAHRR